MKQVSKPTSRSTSTTADTIASSSKLVFYPNKFLLELHMAKPKADEKKN